MTYQEDEFTPEELRRIRAEDDQLRDDDEIRKQASMSSDSEIRRAWMEQGFFFTADLAVPLTKTLRVTNKRLLDAGCAPVMVDDRNRGNNLWLIASLSNLSDDDPDEGTSSVGTGKKKPSGPSGGTSKRRTVKRSKSKSS